MEWPASAKKRSKASEDQIEGGRFWVERGQLWVAAVAE